MQGLSSQRPQHLVNILFLCLIPPSWRSITLCFIWGISLAIYLSGPEVIETRKACSRAFYLIKKKWLKRMWPLRIRSWALPFFNFFNLHFKYYPHSWFPLQKPDIAPPACFYVGGPYPTYTLSPLSLSWPSSTLGHQSLRGPRALLPFMSDKAILSTNAEQMESYVHLSVLF